MPGFGMDSKHTTRHSSGSKPIFSLLPAFPKRQIWGCRLLSSPSGALLQILARSGWPVQELLTRFRPGLWVLRVAPSPKPQNPVTIAPVLRRSSLKTDRVPSCPGPNTHGGSGALLVDWIDVELPLSGLLYFVPKGTFKFHLDQYSTNRLSPRGQKNVPYQNSSVLGCGLSGMFRRASRTLIMRICNPPTCW
jgi:hypothetical protein